MSVLVLFWASLRWSGEVYPNPSQGAAGSSDISYRLYFEALPLCRCVVPALTEGQVLFVPAAPVDRIWADSVTLFQLEAFFSSRGICFEQWPGGASGSEASKERATVCILDAYIL
jgi:hypothetical protein